MKKLLFVVGIFSLILGAGTVYAYIEDCPRRDVKRGVQSDYQNRDYDHKHYYAKYNTECGCQNCDQVKSSNTRNYGYHRHSHHH